MFVFYFYTVILMQFNEYLVGSPIDRRVAEWFFQSDVAPESPFLTYSIRFHFVGVMLAVVLMLKLHLYITHKYCMLVYRCSLRIVVKPFLKLDTPTRQHMPVWRTSLYHFATLYSIHKMTSADVRWTTLFHNELLHSRYCSFVPFSWPPLVAHKMK